MARTFTGRLWDWAKQIDQPGQVVTNALILSGAMLNPIILLTYPVLFAGAAVADGVAAAVAARRAAERRKSEEVERHRRRQEDAEREQKADERRRAEEEVKRRRSTREYKLADAERTYKQALTQIDRDDTLDDIEKGAARVEAKKRYMQRMDKEM